MLASLRKFSFRVQIAWSDGLTRAIGLPTVPASAVSGCCFELIRSQIRQGFALSPNLRDFGYLKLGARVHKSHTVSEGFDETHRVCRCKSNSS